MAGWALLVAVVGIELTRSASPFCSIREMPVYNALQERNWDRLSTIGLPTTCRRGDFHLHPVHLIILKVYQLYLNQWLQIRWRRWMTTRHLGQWLHDANHYRMQLVGDAADNPTNASPGRQTVHRRNAVGTAC